MLFTPSLLEENMLLPDCVVEKGDNQFVTLVIENHGHTVGGPFDRIAVDVIQFPRSRQGNQYAVIFMDSLTKWPEVFPVLD